MHFYCRVWHAIVKRGARTVKWHQELRREPDHWFWALKAITGEDPVAPADCGQLDKMTTAWLNWAEQHGY